jgi:hypothetical protein
MIAAQVEKFLPGDADKLEVTDEDFREDWTHVWEFEGEGPANCPKRETDLSAAFARSRAYRPDPRARAQAQNALNRRGH